jgi:hypothetical protein
VKGSFYEELESVIDKFYKYNVNILLGDFNAKVDREYVMSNDNGVRLVNSATSKNLRVKSTMFLHRNIHKYAWTGGFDGPAHRT